MRYSEMRIIPKASDLRLKLGIVGALVVSTLAVYAPCLNFPFIDYDDSAYVSNNWYVQGGLTATGISWAFTTTTEANWHPLTWLSLQLDTTLFGGSRAGGFHLTNMLLHAANSALLFIVLQFMTNCLWRSAVVAGLFALHPLHVESVVWVAERKDVLCTLFFMLTLAAYARYVWQPGLGHYLLILLVFALGLLAKPMLVTTPFVLLLLDYWPLRRWGTALEPRRQPVAGSDRILLPAVSRRSVLLEKVPLLILATVSCAITFLVQYRTTAMGSIDHYPLSVRVWNALQAYVAYLGMTFWPFSLAVYYPHPGDTVSVATALASAFVLVAITTVVVLGARAWPYLPVGWFWYLGTLVPVVGLVQTGGQSMADRYTYIPLIGIFLALTWGVADLARRLGLRTLYLGAATAVLLVVCADMTRAQLSYWKGDIPLWEHDLAVADESLTAHTNLGAGYLAAGLRKEALGEFGAALKLAPSAPKAHYNLGRGLASLGRHEEALREYGKAIDLDPQLAVAHLGRGQIFRDTGRPNEAVAELKKAVAIEPNLAPAHLSLGVLLVGLSRSKEALDHLQTAIGLDPRQSLAHMTLGFVFDDLGRTNEALAEWHFALRIEPSVARLQAGLGNTLLEKGRLKDAEAVLGDVLEMLDAFAPHDPLRAHVFGQLNRCERLQAEERKLPAYLEGKLQPSGPDQMLELAWLCQTPRVGKPLAAVRFYREAFSRDPKALENFQERHSYDAACAAAKAASNTGGEGLPSEAEKTRLHAQALVWLKPDLTHWIELAARGTPTERQTALDKLRIARQESALAGLLDSDMLKKLPPDERVAWGKLWTDVDAAIAKPAASAK